MNHFLNVSYITGLKKLLVSYENLCMESTPYQTIYLYIIGLLSLVPHRPEHIMGEETNPAHPCLGKTLVLTNLG